MRYIYITILILFSFLHSNAQIKVKQANNSDFKPENLISDIFLGEGIDIIEIHYDGEPYSVGEFTYGPNDLGIKHGLLMTTGEASTAAIPNFSVDKGSSSNGEKETDIDLLNAIGDGVVNDLSRFEIVFVPHSDSISFNYIFASEEYLKYSCAKYNDAFGFFISKMNADGSYTTNKNIATLPTTNEPVSVKNVHPKTDSCTSKNEEFYNNTPEGSNLMTYNGYLNVMSASAKVVPCETYKIKLVIADINDQWRDSAVFLEAKSLSSNVLKTSVSTKNGDGYIVEGCDNAIITFHFKYPVTEDYFLNNRIITNHNLGENAQEDIDFNSIPSNNIIKKGEKSFSFSINAFEDSSNENKEIIAIEYQKDFCNKDTIYLSITDNNLAKINLSDTLVICQNDTINVGATIPTDIKQSDIVYSNNNQYHIPAKENTQVISTITVRNMYSDKLQLNMLKEICIDTLVSKKLVDLDIYLVTPDRTIELSTDNGLKSGDEFDIDTLINTCFTPTATVNINNGNSVRGDYFSNNPTYTGDFQPEGSWNSLKDSKIIGDWKLKIVNDTSGGTASRLDAWHITFNSNYKINYSWSPTKFTSCNTCLSPDIFPLSDTTFHVSLTDNYGCSSQDSIRAKVNREEIIPFIDCDSISTDYIRFKWGVVSPNEDYEIKINGASNWSKITNNYFEKNNLNFSEIVSIEVRIVDEDCENTSVSHQCQTYKCPAPQISIISKKDNICFGDKFGEIQLDAFGTTAPYTFELNGNKNNTGFFNNLSSGLDTIFVTDGDSCLIPFPFIISQPDDIKIQYDITDISCFGDQNGSIKAIASKGNNGFTYTWTDRNNQLINNDQTISNLDSGFYYIFVKDKLNCVSSDSVYLKMPELLSVSDSVYDIECKGDTTGKIILDIIGGTPDYTYNWNTPNGYSNNKDILNSTAGNYFVTIADAHNCKITKLYNIHEPPDGLNINYAIKDSLCYGENNGFISINTPPNSNYTFAWNNGFTGNYLDSLGEGIYSITVTDSKGCQKIIDEYIEELAPIAIFLKQDSASCHNFADGKAWVDKVFYGNRDANINNFNFNWNTPGGNSQYVFDLTGGQVYTVEAINSFGCKAIESIKIGNPRELLIDLIELKDVSCFGANDGYIEVALDGGNNLYNYQWSTNSDAGNKNYAENLKTGLYKLLVTDLKGCTTEKLFNIKQPDPISITFNTDNVKCYKGNDGNATALVKGGTKPYIYDWKDFKINENKIDSISAGTYSIQITDLNGCIKKDSIVIIQPTDSIYSVLETKDVSCYGGFDGEVTFTTMGGSPPYSNKVLGRDFYPGNKIIGLKSGNYSSVTRDINGCTDTINEIVISEPDKITVDIGKDTIVDYGTTIQPKAIIKNTSSPIQYKWIIPEGTGTTCTTCEFPELVVLYNFLLALEIEDSNGCTARGEKQISVDLSKDIFVPEAFKPSSQIFSNKKLYVYGKNGIKVKTFAIYNKWNNLVYKRDDFFVNDEADGWDGSYKGTALNSDMFLWNIEVINIDNTVQKYKGTVTLIR